MVGRFLSNDPVGFASGGVDYFNRHAYTFNDPVNNIDPDGEFFNFVAGAVAGVIAGAVDVGIQAATKGIDNIDFAQSGRAALITGATASLGPGAGVALSAAINGVASGVEAGLNSEKTGFERAADIAVATGIGAATSALTGGRLGAKATAGLAVRELSGSRVVVSGVSEGVQSGLQSATAQTSGAGLVKLAQETSGSVAGLGRASIQGAADMINEISDPNNFMEHPDFSGLDN